MIIAFAIIALIIVSGLSIGIYAVFIPFMQNISEIQSYNTAYYGAIAATERALLITKQQEFGFNGSGGRKGTQQRGPTSDYSDPAMGIITQENNGTQRQITGKTTRIPQEGQGNIPVLFAANDSKDFNKLSSQDTIVIAMQINNNNNPQLFYTQTNNITKPTRTFLNTQRRIPPYIQQQQPDQTNSLLCDSYNSICSNGSSVDDDTVVLRKRGGTYGGSEFSIIPTTQIFRTTGDNYIGSNDMHIRESFINEGGLLSFNNDYNPIRSSSLSEHTTLGPGGDNIKNIVFTNLFNTPTVEELYVQYTMTQPPISKAGFIYPFLEYVITSDAEMSDTHRHIQSQGTVGNYEVKIQIQKPQNKYTKGSNFTIIF